MSFFWRREKPNVDRRQSLRGVPVWHAGVHIQRDQGGKTMLCVSHPPRAGWLDRFRPRADSRRYELDDFGAFVVNLMDGTRTVLEIIDRFQSEFGLSRRESELGVVAFIKMLMQRRLLSVAIERAVVERGTSSHHADA